MVFRKLGQGLLNAGANAVGSVAKTGLQGAGWLTKELGKVAINNGPGFLKAVTNGTVKVVGTAANGVYTAGNFAIKTSDGYIGFSTLIGDTIDNVDDGLQGVRNNIARNIRQTSQNATDVTEVASEITSFIGFFPLASDAVNFLADPLIGGTGDYLSRLVRGNRIAFVDLEIKEPGLFGSFFGGQKDVLAIMYMPKDKNSDRAGFAVMNEDALIGMCATYEDGSRESKAFKDALEKVVAKKQSLGLDVHAPGF